MEPQAPVDQPVNEVEIQALGMSRSGNHAIADWIYAQAEAPKLVLNCAEGKTNPYLTCRPLASGRGWRSAGVDMEAERAGRRSRKALVMHTYEDSWLAHAFSRELDREHDAWLGPSRRRVALLVVRDPFNLFASRTKMGAALSPGIARKMWKQHAREALGETRRIKRELVVVRYNLWAKDDAYRAALAERLGLGAGEADIDRVAACNAGSSFDGLTYDGRAREMPVEDRWRAYADDPAFRAIFDEEMMRLSDRLFGRQAAIEALVPAG